MHFNEKLGELIIRLFVHGLGKDTPEFKDENKDSIRDGSVQIEIHSPENS